MFRFSWAATVLFFVVYSLSFLLHEYILNNLHVNNILVRVNSLLHNRRIDYVL